MAVRLLHEVEIEAPKAAVWDAFCRLEHWPRWFPLLLAVEREGEGPFAVEDRFTLRLSFRGHAADVPVRVVEHHQGARVRWIGKNLGVTGDHAFYLESLGPTRTRFISDETFTGLPTRFIPRSVFDQIETATKEGLCRFRALVEPTSVR